jgi:hypothetical protein
VVLDQVSAAVGGRADLRGLIAGRGLGQLTPGIGYRWLRRNHPNWPLNAAGNGRPLQFRGYPGTWETDYGSPAYQRQWTRNVIADVRGHGWDGVDVDNAFDQRGGLRARG